MWHKLAQKFTVLLMPQGMVWYREHAEQEMNNFRKYLKTYTDVKIKYLFSYSCPLNKEETKKIIGISRRIARNEVIKGILTINRNRVKDNLIRLIALYNAS